MKDLLIQAAERSGIVDAKTLTDFLTENVIEQGRLPHIGSPHDGDITTTSAVSSHVRSIFLVHSLQRLAPPCDDFCQSPRLPSEAG